MNYIGQIINQNYSGQRVPRAVLINEAKNNLKFARQWLIHCVSSTLDKEELAIVLSLAQLHKLQEIQILNQYYPKFENVETESRYIDHSLKFISDIVYSVEIDVIWKSLLKEQKLESECLKDRVTISQTLLTSQLAEKVITATEPALTPVTVYAEQSIKQIHDIRDNEQLVAHVPVENIYYAMLQRLMCIDNLERLKFAEPMMLYRYVKGQQYKWHFDFVTPSNEQALNEINFFGQRDETKIIYLNEGFEGGETSFKYWEVTAKPKLGKLVQFNNILNGKVDKESVHAGKPVTQGVKWIATLWTREKPYWMRASIWN